MKDEEGKAKEKTTKGRKRRKRRLTFTPRKANKVYQCDKCPAKFARDTQLQYHAKAHKEDTEVGGCL